jgi:hypothetical protein
MLNKHPRQPNLVLNPAMGQPVRPIPNPVRHSSAPSSTHRTDQIPQTPRNTNPCPDTRRHPPLPPIHPIHKPANIRPPTDLGPSNTQSTAAGPIHHYCTHHGAVDLAESTWHRRVP